MSSKREVMETRDYVSMHQKLRELELRMIDQAADTNRKFSQKLDLLSSKVDSELLTIA